MLLWVLDRGRSFHKIPSYVSWKVGHYILITYPDTMIFSEDYSHLSLISSRVDRISFNVLLKIIKSFVA